MPVSDAFYFKNCAIQAFNNHFCTNLQVRSANSPYCIIDIEAANTIDDGFSKGELTANVLAAAAIQGRGRFSASVPGQPNSGKDNTGNLKNGKQAELQLPADTG